MPGYGNIARYRRVTPTDPYTWDNMNNGLNNIVTSLVLGPGNALIVGGQFTINPNTNNPNLAIYTPSGGW